MVEHERAPGIGLLAGWRGADGAQDGVGTPNTDQLARYVEHGCHWHREIPSAGRYYKMANRDYLEWAKSLAFVGSTQPIVLQFYAESLQRFRLAAQGHGATQPPDRERERVERYFDPLPFWYGSISRESIHEQQGKTAHQCADFSSEAHADYPLAAITQRPMFMYHSWGSQNKWLRQIATRNYLYLHPDTAAAQGVMDDDWIWLVAPGGRIRVQARTHNGTAPGTVWTWNAIGKRKGAWKLDAKAPENVDGFLLNHLIDESLRDRDGHATHANADPVTGQAAWFDLRVRIECDPQPRVEGHRIEMTAAGVAG
jgi:anaerobic selenocysteine-containing dehydrogenase